jgi:hypothetical protein
MATRAKPTLMVASTVYHFEDQLDQLCAVLNGFGYTVWNSRIGTIPVHPGFSNLENCVRAVRDCDLFLAIIRPYYGSRAPGTRSITHEECREAVRLDKPRWFLVHRDVTFASRLLEPYLHQSDGTRTHFVFRRSSVLDDVRVIDLYNDVIQNGVLPAHRKGHWAQEFYRLPEILTYINSQFRNVARIRRILREMPTPCLPGTCTCGSRKGTSERLAFGAGTMPPELIAKAVEPRS